MLGPELHCERLSGRRTASVNHPSVRSSSSAAASSATAAARAWMPTARAARFHAKYTWITRAANRRRSRRRAPSSAATWSSRPSNTSRSRRQVALTSIVTPRATSSSSSRQLVFRPVRTLSHGTNPANLDRRTNPRPRSRSSPAARYAAANTSAIGGAATGAPNGASSVGGGATSIASSSSPSATRGSRRDVAVSAFASRTASTIHITASTARTVVITIWPVSSCREAVRSRA